MRLYSSHIEQALPKLNIILRSRIKRLLRKRGYPPEQATDATETVIEQAEQISRDWAEAA